MASNIKLEILLEGVDDATAALKQLRDGVDSTAQAVKAGREQLRQLNDLYPAVGRHTDQQRARQARQTAQQYELERAQKKHEQTLKRLQSISRHGGAIKDVGLAAFSYGSQFLSEEAKQDFEELRQAWDGIGTSIQKSIDGPMRSLFQRLTEVLQQVSEWIEANPKLIGGIAVAGATLAGMVVAVGTLVQIAAAVSIQLAILRYSLTALSIYGQGAITTFTSLAKRVLPAVGKALLWLGRLAMGHPIIALIAVLVGAAIYIWRNWETLGPLFAALWDNIKNAGAAAWAWLKDSFSMALDGLITLITEFSPLALFYKAFSGVMSWFGVELPDQFTDFGRQMLQGLIKGIFDMGSRVKDAITNIGDRVAGWFRDRLKIRSPSRVFAEAGRDTLAGYQLGLARSEHGPLKQIDGFGKRVKQISTGIALGVSALPAAAGVQFDQRAPLGGSLSGVAAAAGDNVTINIYAAPGMAADEVGREVARQLALREREKAARRRSALYDME
ncbi:hypothetical protein CAI21_01455 [Alkalilimnicola ehrlichii]|uniref:Phage tail tape measure protein n=1 Tax=Alkalilimnicola ehrlichii TaxID=351052 RepID=A0A3E0X3W8_9GAMM|nr:hypothetical protein [Alkalilimnicola ehrlichii]RFA31322.1 hypothetical protein CAI21_01455 [Alkalilimnicola ehrlichii]RFA39404.1 hypothetical protein CAL65_00955 [Alkalilimnicola ehrlichii]